MKHYLYFLNQIENTFIPIHTPTSEFVFQLDWRRANV